MCLIRRLEWKQFRLWKPPLQMVEWHNKATGSHIGGPLCLARTAVNDVLLWFRMGFGQINCRQSSILVRVINQHDQTLHFLPEFLNINTKAAFLYLCFSTLFAHSNHPMHLHLGTRCGFLQISDITAKPQLCSVPWLALMLFSPLFPSDVWCFPLCPRLCCSLIQHALRCLAQSTALVYCMLC